MEEAQNILSERIELLLIGIVLAFISSFIAWKRGFYMLPKSEPEEGAPLSFFELIGAFIVFLVIEMLIVPLITLILISLKQGQVLEEEHLQIDPLTQGWMNLCAIFLTAFGLWIYVKMLPPQSRHLIWGSKAFISLKKIWSDLYLGFLTWLLSYPFVIVVGQIIAVFVFFEFTGPHVDQVAVKHLKTTSASPILFWLTICAIVSIVPVLEELLFRGFLQTWLKTYTGRLNAIWISALIFALFHFSMHQGIDNIELLSSLFVLACFLGYLFERQQSLWAPIGLHSIFNLISIAMIIGNE